MKVLTALALLMAIGGNAQPAGGTRIAVSKDGTRLAYDVTGRGPVLLLLHGGGQTRRVWHDAGYVSRLAPELTVVTMDMRGHGESDKPDTVEAYAIDRLTEDVLAVADAAGAARFTLWGFSYGANIGRYVAARSDRVRAMAYIGIQFGPASEGVFRTNVLEMRAKWTPIIEGHRKGKDVDLQSLFERDRAAWQRGTVPVSVAWTSAMLDYPPIEPGDMRCPTLWLVGTANEGTMPNVTVYQPKLAGTKVSLALLEGLTHFQELERIDQALPPMLEFTRAHR